MPETRAKIKEYLAISISVLAILAAIGTYTNSKAQKAIFEYKVEQNEKEIAVLKAKTEHIPVMQTDIKNVAKDVDEIKDIVEMIRDKLIPVH